MIPTIGQVMDKYRVIVPVERMKTGRPSEVSMNNVLRGVRQLCRAAEIPMDATIDVFTRQRVEKALLEFDRRGMQRISAESYEWNLQSLFGRWCRAYYEDAGWEIPELNLPVVHSKLARYVRPSAELIDRVKAWYGTLKGAEWFAATMMLEFAMRNGDVLRLTDDNFVMRAENVDGKRVLRPYLSYTPHKTAQSSGRQVLWPIHDSIWQTYKSYGGVSGLDVTDETFKSLNRDLRAMGFTGTKGAYELRKICIDHIYQRYGAEIAVSLSGDDIKTISRYYADPAQPKAGVVRVIQLL